MTDGGTGRHAAPEGTDEPDDKAMPSFSEQMADQLGGVRGLIEASIPVTAFVVINFLGSQFDWWELRTTIIVSMVIALALAVYRLSRREPVRHALNGLFGVGLGAWLAWRSGEARDFYLPGIILTAAQAGMMLLSVAARYPAIGWFWSVMFDRGATRWRDDPRLRRAFGWLTVIWATVYLTKVTVQYGLYLANQDDLLGIARLVLGWPPYALLLAATVWTVRRITRHDEAPTVAVEPVRHAAS